MTNNFTKIRRGVFETNSSSTHSISIASGAETYDTLPLDEKGVCRIYPGEFGWEVETYSDAPTKASYAMVWAHQYGKKEHRDMLKTVIMNWTDAKRVVFCKEDSYWSPRGYIDHQSDDVAAQAFVSNRLLADFIFNPASVLRTDNDNH